jgi:predicted amidohydrolase
MARLKVAAIQACSQADDFEQKWQGVDVEHALELLDRAAGRGADLACFPELYPLVGERELRAKARGLGIYVIAGLADGTRRQWHNTSSLISPTGDILGRQTKNYPTAIERAQGVVPGNSFDVFETDIGRFGIIVCADFTFFSDGVEQSRSGKADIIFNPAVWFAMSEFFPHVIVGRHLEYSVPIFGVNLARRSDGRNDPAFPPAGGFSTVCIPPHVADMDQLWEWFRSKPGGIDSIQGVVQTLGHGEDVLVAEVDIDAVRQFPGYFSIRGRDAHMSALAPTE